MPEDPGGGDEADAAVPEYIFPLFFTSKTQEIFACKAGEQLTDDEPFIIISKARIIQDFKDRAAISDFHPAKAIVQKYPGEDILIGYDPDFKFGQNYFLVTTEEGKEFLLKPPEVEQEEDANDEEAEFHDDEILPIELRVCQPWISLGSEKEVEEETVKNTRDKLRISISRKRKEFGYESRFTDRNASDKDDGIIDCFSYEDPSFSINRMQIDNGIQHVPQVADNTSQTVWLYPKNQCIQYSPREFDEDTQKEMLASENILNFMNTIYNRFDLALKQNEVVDLFIDDYRLLAEDDGMFGSKSDNHLKEYQSFTDLKFTKHKQITFVDWHPTIQGLVAVSCCQTMTFDERINQSSQRLMSPSLVLIWSFADPIHPLLMLEAPDDIQCFQFNPSDPNIIAAGSINGQIVLWDVTKYEQRLANHQDNSQSSQSKQGTATTLPSFFNLIREEMSPIVRYCAVSSVEGSHRMSITAIQWLPRAIEINKMGVLSENTTHFSNQLMTCSPDGVVLFWDTRPAKSTTISTDNSNNNEFISAYKHLDLTWKPLLKVTLHQQRGMSLLAPISISTRHSQGHHNLSTGDSIEAHQQSIQTKDESNNTEAIATKFFVGTEVGELVYADLKPIKDMDTGKFVTQKPEKVICDHDGVISSLERSPFFEDIILSIGGCTFSIWKEGVWVGPLLKSSCSEQKLTCGKWSPTRAGVFFIATNDGNVEAWDLLDRTHEPFFNQSISAVKVTTISPFQISLKLQLLAIGDEVGTLHVMEVPWNLRHPSGHEISSIESYFDREEKRLIASSEQQKISAKAKAKLEDDDDSQIKKTDDKGAQDDAGLEAESQQEYDEYIKLEQRLLQDFGMASNNDD